MPPLLDTPYRCPHCRGVSPLDRYEVMGLDGVRCPKCREESEGIERCELVELVLPERATKGCLF